jgi:putative endonuclease
MSKGWMYILECADGSYYTGSTKNLELRLAQHQAGEGANHTKKHLPVKLVYYEEFQRIDEAFYREKQVQGWSRKKKEALIAGMPEQLHQLAECLNETHYKNYNAVTEESNNSVAEESHNAVAERSRSTATGGFGSAQPPEDGNRCLSEVEGSEVEGSEVEGSIQ